MRRVLALLLLAGVAAGQVFHVGPTRDSPPEECLQLVVNAVPLAARPGGQGWVEVQVENRGEATRDLLLELNVARIGASSRRSLAIEAGARRRLMLPLPGMTLGAGPLFATVDDGDRQHLDVDLDAAGTVSALVVSDDPSGAGLDLQQQTEREIIAKDIHFQHATGEALPGSWTMISGADLLLVDGATRLSAEAQQVLLDAASAGAELYVRRPQQLIDGVGPLSEALRVPEFEGRASSHGLVRVPRGFGAVSMSGAQTLDKRGELYDLPDTWRGATSGFPADSWLERQLIPGLDEIPTGLFLLLLLGFILFVAWRSIVLLRQRRPLRLLLVLPGSGLAMTAGLLVAGLLSDGITARGVRRSITLLDQRNHRAAAVCQAMVYAPLGGGELAPRPETLLSSMDLLTYYGHDTVPRIWQVNLDEGGRIGAGAIPPRTPTELSTSTVGLARERLRFRRVDDALEVVADPDLRPVKGPGALVLRDFEGRCYRDQGSGRLERIANPMPKELWSGTIVSTFGSLDGEVVERDPFMMLSRGRVREVSDMTTTSAEDNLPALIAGLPTGAWVGLVERSPSVDELGLEVDWVQEAHIVMGLLAPEDIDG